MTLFLSAFAYWPVWLTLVAMAVVPVILACVCLAAWTAWQLAWLAIGRPHVGKDLEPQSDVPSIRSISLPPRGTALAFRHMSRQAEILAKQAYWGSQVRRSSVLLFMLVGLPLAAGSTWGIPTVVVLVFLTAVSVTPAAVGMAVWWVVSVGSWARWRRMGNGIR